MSYDEYEKENKIFTAVQSMKYKILLCDVIHYKGKPTDYFNNMHKYDYVRQNGKIVYETDIFEYACYYARDISHQNIRCAVVTNAKLDHIYYDPLIQIEEDDADNVEPNHHWVLYQNDKLIKEHIDMDEGFNICRENENKGYKMIWIAYA